jgi:hypothetical protein
LFTSAALRTVRSVSALQRGGSTAPQSSARVGDLDPGITRSSHSAGVQHRVVLDLS